MYVRTLFLLAFYFLLSQEFSYAQTVLSFRGSIDFVNGEYAVVLDLKERGLLAIKAQRASEKEYRVVVDAEHLKTPFFDLVSKIESSIEVAGEGGPASQASRHPVLFGKVWSRYSLLDYKPAGELSGHFEIRDMRLYLTSLSMGNLACVGSLGLMPPFPVDLTVHLVDVAMSDFLNFWGPGQAYASSGAVSGSIRASGVPGRLMLKGNLESQRGFVQKLDYDTIVLNAQGIYPHMHITRSSVSKSDGVSFSLAGPFDLSDSASFRKQIKALTIAPLVNDFGSRLEWTIKRFKPEDLGTTELKYRLRKGDRFGAGTSAENEIDMLGIERSRKF